MGSNSRNTIELHKKSRSIDVKSCEAILRFSELIFSRLKYVDRYFF